MFKPALISRPALQRLLRLAPGLGLCAILSAAALGLQAVETRWLGRAWLEALVLAILLGAAVRAVWTPDARWMAGVDFSAKTLLELAVVLLGVTVDARAVLAVGLPLLAGVAALVASAIAISYGLGRLFHLPRRMALLIACGNAICGNSAIAAVAPVIGAEGEDAAAAIAFTALLGVLVVLGLPPLALGLGLSHRAAGVLAGLTVYAVPQVLAATAPISAASVQIGALVKLVRVLMLGPVVTLLSLLEAHAETADGAAPARPPMTLGHMMPWFILGFLALVAARALGLTPAAVAAPAAGAASALTVVSMAALGLNVDFHALRKAGPRVSAVVVLSLAMLGALALGLLRALSLV